MSLVTVIVGSRRTFTATFARLGVPANPDIALFKVQDPSGAETTYLSSDPLVTAVGGGVYTLRVDFTRKGTWRVRAVGTGNGQAATELTVQAATDFARP